MFLNFLTILLDVDSTGGSGNDAPDEKATNEPNADNEVAELRRKFDELSQKNAQLYKAHEAVKGEKKELKELLKQNKTQEQEQEQEQEQTSINEIQDRYKNQVADLETRLSEKDTTIKELGFKHSRETMIDKLDKALLNNGADPECVEFLRQKLINSGKIKETILEDGTIDFKYLDASGNYEYRDQSSNDWKLYEPKNLAKDMAESGTFDKWFLSQKAAGFGGDVSVSHRQATKAQMYQNEYDKAKGNAQRQRLLMLNASRENIRIQT